ncbi:MAG: hypothetical protein QMD53_02345 [Actinomycetota bacterium]|nr:hypothetical protein [Actinomycetota bacterium]
MGREDTRNAKFLLGLLAGLGMVCALSPTLRELVKDRLEEAMDNSKPHLIEAMGGLIKILDEAKLAAVQAEADLLGSKLKDSQEVEEPLDYIV